MRFFLDETHKREIIVQLTLWDWFDIAALSWSEEEIVEPQWDQYDGTSRWGPQRILTLAPENHRSYIALVRVFE